MKRTMLVAAALCCSALLWSDWPQFQGPNRDGVSTETVKLADTWPEGGPKVAWKNNSMGRGYAGAVIQDKKVYVLDRVSDQKDVLRCLDLETGAEDWTYSYDCPGKYPGNYNGSRNQPAVDDKHVFILGPFGQLTCVSKETHDKVWQKNIIEEYGATFTNWGLCQSPTMYKDTVIVAPTSDKAGVVAFDKATGKEAWKSACLGTPKEAPYYAWSSPLVATVDGQDMVVVLNCRNAPVLSGVDATNGKTLWTYKKWKGTNPIASPIAIPGGMFFITGGYNKGGAMVKVSKAGDAWNVDEVFNNLVMSSQGQNPIFYKGFIYGHSSWTGAGVECIDLKGEVKWKSPEDTPEQKKSNGDQEEIGAVLIADGKLFSLLSQGGTLRMLAASPDGYKELASAKVIGGSENWGVMGYSDGRLILRSKSTLVCLDLR